MKCYIRQSDIKCKPKKDLLSNKETRRKEMAKKFDTLIKYTDEEVYMNILVEIILVDLLDSIDFNYILMFSNYVPVIKTIILKILPEKIEYTTEPYIGIRRNKPIPHYRTIPTSTALSKINMIEYLTNRYGEKFIDDNNIKYPSEEDTEQCIYEFNDRPSKDVIRDELFEYWMKEITPNDQANQKNHRKLYPYKHHMPVDGSISKEIIPQIIAMSPSYVPYKPLIIEENKNEQTNQDET